jgi:ribonucleotide reductase alpha subunit
MSSDNFEGTQGSSKELTDEAVNRGEEEPSGGSEEVVSSNQGTMDIPSETIAAFSGDELRARVFYEKYALRDSTGRIVEKTPEEMWKRVAHEISSPEKTQKLKNEWQENFYWLLSDFRFIPGGRVLFGAGQNRRSTLLNCYFMPIKNDSIESIFEWCKEAGVSVPTFPC